MLLELLRKRRQPAPPISHEDRNFKRQPALTHYNRMISLIAHGQFTPAMEETNYERAFVHAIMITLSPQEQRDEVNEALTKLKNDQERTGRTNGIPDIITSLLDTAKNLVSQHDQRRESP